MQSWLYKTDMRERGKEIHCTQIFGSDDENNTAPSSNKYPAMQLHMGPHGKPAATGSLLGIFYINPTENSYGEAKTKRMVKPKPRGW
ncbi:hypothetical protein AV530_000684 [Patagioenas fasciata monilis]|uniref:Uncharacterized protein n=1 Tax=Patagioenas fasciata monilis TaxID=372326 RepID=A0A1V4IGC2_PATFA|nr:hypothetical protein AV530_000684 [Patagioenas fasciata monilis]